MSSSIPVNPTPLPIGDPLAERRKEFKGNSLGDVIRYLKTQDSLGFITQTWQRFFSQLQSVITATPTRINLVELETKSASIAATDFSDGSLAAGWYEVKPYSRITTIAGVASSLILTLAWTDKGTSVSHAYTAWTSNIVGDIPEWSPLLIRVDSASPITYATTYVSNPAAAMVYDLGLVLERVAA